MGDIKGRRDTYAQVTEALAKLDDDEAQSALAAGSSKARTGWGTSGTAELGGHKVFVKRVPLTDVEHRHMPSTKNRFRLPDYYHYGVGSAGYGVFRELAIHRKTTDWVIRGEIDSFPLLYHDRVLPRTKPADDPRFKLDEYVRRWNGSKAVANFIAARARASHEVWLVLEHFPNTMATWLHGNQGEIGRVVDELCRTVAFLRTHGIVHFDAHLWNVVGDGHNSV